MPATGIHKEIVALEHQGAGSQPQMESIKTSKPTREQLMQALPARLTAADGVKEQQSQETGQGATESTDRDMMLQSAANQIKALGSTEPTLSWLPTSPLLAL